MLSIISVCLFVVFCGATDYPTTVDPSKKVIYAATMSRIGFRTPYTTFPNDPYMNVSKPYPPYGLAKLTNEGVDRMYGIGAFLGVRYNDLIANASIPQDIWAQSIDEDSVKMSLLAILASAFPPAGTPYEWNKFLNWNPIPIQFSPLSQDDLLVGRVVCPRYYEALTEVLASPRIQKINKKYAELYKAIAEFSGANITNAIAIYNIVDALRTQADSLCLEPIAGSEQFFTNVSDVLPLFNLAYDILVWTPEMKRIRSCKFIERLASEFAAKSNGSFERKISINVGYVSTLTTVLDAFGVRNGTYLAEGYTVLFELVLDVITGEFLVQLFLHTDENSGAIPLPLPDCGESCPLDQFLRIARRLSCGDYDQLCCLKDPNFTVTSPTDPAYTL